MTIRIINKDGKDELYKNVIKATFLSGWIHIYCDGFQYKELVQDIDFLQTWEDK
jgi:hypothetical protein